MVGERCDRSDRQLLPESFPSADVEEPERIGRAAAGVPPVPPAAAGPTPAGTRPGQQNPQAVLTQHSTQERRAGDVVDVEVRKIETNKKKRTELNLSPV